MGTWIQAEKRGRPVKNKKRFWFSGGLILLIFAMCLFIYPVASSLTIYSGSQKQELLNSLEYPLEQLAVEQARIVDPNYEWIVYEEGLSDEIKSAIRDNTFLTQKSYVNRTSDEYLAGDTNLAWKITYDGKSYEHKWDPAYEEQSGILDITFTSSGGQVVMDQDAVEGYTPGFSVFNIQNRTVVNPNLLDSQEANKEFYYYILLPEGFSIHYFIPSTLKANGGLIAQITGRLDGYRNPILMAGGALILILYILAWSKNIERQAPVFRRFIQMKALGCLLSLAIGLTAFGILTPMVSYWTATGILKEKMFSMGLANLQMQSLVPVILFSSWFLFFYILAIAITYVKYIFAFGLVRYVKEDTVVADLIRKSDSELEKTIKIPLNEWTWQKLFPVVLVGILLVLVAVYAGALFFGYPGAIGSFIIILILFILLARRSWQLLHQDYMTTLLAVNEMAQGNFSDVTQKQVGTFQTLYNSLIDVKEGFQSALKDALANQNMKTQLISNVSHDLKTPVTGIKSYSELISMASSLEEAREYAKRLEGYTDRLNSLIEDLFDVSRASSGDIQLNKMNLNLAELVRQVESEWEDTLAKKQVTIISELPQEAMTILDPDKTRRIIDNLLSNIFKYTMEGTRVFISMQELPSEYVLIFKNISKTPLDFSAQDITERFVRGDKSRHEPGAGLGLAIVKSFMEVQDGSCTIDIDGDVFKAILTFAKVQPAQTLPQPPLLLNDAKDEVLSEDT